MIHTRMFDDRLTGNSCRIGNVKVSTSCYLGETLNHYLATDCKEVQSSKCKNKDFDYADGLNKNLD